MKYKDKELKEANGADYPLSSTPKRMLVWFGEIPYERDVLGYVNGCWVVAATGKGDGVVNWVHAAEIPPEEETLLTRRELAKWLAQGCGEYRHNDMSYAYDSYTYEVGTENYAVQNSVKIRKWDDSDWHRPTREYAFGEE